MERLFNEYEALNELGEVFESRASIFIEELLDEILFRIGGGEVSIRDVEAVVCGTISVRCAEERLRRAVEKRKSGREANPWPCTHPGCEERGLYPANCCEAHGMSPDKP